MEDTTAPSQRQKRSRSASEDDDEAGDDTAGAARGSSRLAAGIDGAAVAEEKPAETFLLFIEEEDEEAAACTEEPDDGTPHALREIDFFYYPPDDGGRRGGLFAAGREPAVDVALTLGGTGPLAARREDTVVDATLRLGLGPPPSAATDAAAAALSGEAEDDDDDPNLQLHLHGVPFSAGTGAPKLDDPFWYPLIPFADDPCREPPPSPATPEDYSAVPEEGGGFVVVPDEAFNSFVEFVTDDDATDRRPSGATVLDLNQQPCSSEFPDDIAGDVDDDERPGRETAEQRHQSSTPYTFI